MALSGFEKTLWMIAIPTTIIFAFQMIIVFFGLDIDGADDIDTDVDDDHSFGWFSFKNLINFLVIFSWSGIVCIDNELSHAITILLSVGAGILFVIILASLMHAFSKLAEDGTPDLSQLIGMTGTVYLTIPSDGFGKINIMYGGSKKILNAASSTMEKLQTGVAIEVDNIKGDTILVKRFITNGN